MLISPRARYCVERSRTVEIRLNGLFRFLARHGCFTNPRYVKLSPSNSILTAVDARLPETPEIMSTLASKNHFRRFTAIGQSIRNDFHSIEHGIRVQQRTYTPYRHLLETCNGIRALTCTFVRFSGVSLLIGGTLRRTQERTVSNALSRHAGLSPIAAIIPGIRFRYV